MRPFIALAALAILLVPPTMASTALPEDWSASGEALWDVCIGDLAAGSLGPMLVGEHAGQWWFWVDISAREGSCAPVHREGWIDGPYAKHPQVLQSDEDGGSLVMFREDAEGRSMQIYDWTVADGEMVEELSIVSAISDGRLARLG